MSIIKNKYHNKGGENSGKRTNERWRDVNPGDYYRTRHLVNPSIHIHLCLVSSNIPDHWRPYNPNARKITLINLNTKNNN